VVLIVAQTTHCYKRRSNVNHDRSRNFERFNVDSTLITQARVSVLQRVAVCCAVLQCVAVCCSVLQCVALFCSVLQCVAVCFKWAVVRCSALQ